MYVFQLQLSMILDREWYIREYATRTKLPFYTANENTFGVFELGFIKTSF